MPLHQQHRGENSAAPSPTCTHVREAAQCQVRTFAERVSTYHVYVRAYVRTWVRTYIRAPLLFLFIRFVILLLLVLLLIPVVRLPRLSAACDCSE